MNKINEQIKKIHEQMKKRGEWDRLPIIRKTYEEFHCFKTVPETSMESVIACNAYIAQKLDLITEAIVLAMKARRDGKMAGSRWNIGMWEGNNTRDCHALYVADHLGSYESILALALIRTMDLMGFYGEPVNSKFIPWDEYCDGPRLDAISLSRWCVRHLSRSSIENGATHVLFGVVNSILRIAELDEIDIQWHLDARLRWESE